MIQILISTQDLADPGKVMGPELRAAMTEATLLLERDAKKGMPIGVTGAGRGSIASEVRGGLAFGLGEVVGTVGSPLKHVAVINDGRRPGEKMPPPDALELWVRRKIKWSKREGPHGGRRALTTAEAKSLAWVIAKSIGKKGIEGRHFYEAALEKNRGTIEEIFSRAGFNITIKLTKGS